MTDGELGRLERDVEEARRRVVMDIHRLRSPGALSEVKGDLSSELSSTRDSLMGMAKDAAAERAYGVLDEVKARIAANPAAALAIGAGLAWRLARHPPIASVLVGWGLISLLRTDRNHPGIGADLVNRAADFAESSQRKIEDWRSGGGDSDDAPGVGERIAELADDAKARLADAGEAARATASRTLSAAEHAARRGQYAIRRAWEREEERDKYLMGAAALAMAAAVGIAYQRRAHHEGADGDH
jgi:hypothetical protein